MPMKRGNDDMAQLAALIAALLQLGLRLLEKCDAQRAADFRTAVADDPCGVLVAKLGGKGNAPRVATTAKPDRGATGRD